MLLKASLAVALSLALPTAALAQDTDIWLGHLDLSGGRVAITELGTHSVLYDLTTGKARQLPSARGYSPTLTDSVRVGFYSPVDAHTGVLFLNEPARRIVISPRGDLHRFHLAPRAHVVRLLVRLG